MGWRAVHSIKSGHWQAARNATFGPLGEGLTTGAWRGRLQWPAVAARSAVRPERRHQVSAGRRRDAGAPLGFSTKFGPLTADITKGELRRLYVAGKGLKTWTILCARDPLRELAALAASTSALAAKNPARGSGAPRTRHSRLGVRHTSRRHHHTRSILYRGHAVGRQRLEEPTRVDHLFRRMNAGAALLL